MQATVLYERPGLKVTSSWLIVGNNSYAVRYIQQLTLRTQAPPRQLATIVFISAVGMCFWQVTQMMSESMTPLLGWMLLLPCVALLLGSGYVAALMQSAFCLDVHFVGTLPKLHLARPTKADVAELQTALQAAIDLHRQSVETQDAYEDD